MNQTRENISNMGAYYNEHDTKAAAWLGELVKAGEIFPGVVDDRDIQQVTADELRDYDRCHFFAGIGGWDYALRLAGWPATRPVWTASLPCQPFSAAGKRRGTEDERHLWPVFRDLVAECLPPVIFGEQVASKAALGRSSYASKKRGVESLLDGDWESTTAEPESAWFPTVQADLEDLGYIVGASDIPAAGVGAPHIRQRLYWCAVRQQWELPGTGSARVPEVVEERFGVGGLAYRSGSGLEVEREQPAREECATTERGGATGGLPHTESVGSGGDFARREQEGGIADRRNSAWDDVVYLPCADGKARPLPRATESSPEQMATSFPPLVVRGGDQSAQIDAEASAKERVMRLRGYGNAINAQVAAVFIQSVMEAL